MIKYNIYVARPITGCSSEEVKDWYIKVKKQLEFYGYDVCIPFAEQEEIRTEEYKACGYTGLISDHSIYERDKFFAQRCDVLLCDLSMATKISIGCTCEVTWASSRTIPAHIVVVMDKSNPNYHAFILQGADVIVDSHEEAMNYLKRFNA